MIDFHDYPLYIVTFQVLLQTCLCYQCKYDQSVTLKFHCYDDVFDVMLFTMLKFNCPLHLIEECVLYFTIWLKDSTNISTVEKHMILSVDIFF